MIESKEHKASHRMLAVATPEDEEHLIKDAADVRRGLGSFSFPPFLFHSLVRGKADCA
jgi:hypothetical protein